MSKESVEPDILYNAIKITCPVCGNSRIEWEEQLYYNPELLVCSGIEFTAVELDEDVPF
jgi:C4-type Zn-finger protein